MQVRFQDLRFGGPEDDTCGTDSEKGAIVDDTPFLGREFYIVDEGACIAVVVLEGVAQTAFFVPRDGDGAVVQVDAGVYGLEGAVGRITFLVAANHIVAHPQRKHLFIMEYIFYDDDGSATFLIRLLVRVFVFLTVTELAYAHADTKFLATIGTFEDQRLTGFILSFVEGDVLVALRTPHAFHKFNPCLLV